MRRSRLLAATFSVLLPIALVGQAQAAPGDLYVNISDNSTGNVSIERVTPSGAASLFSNTQLKGFGGLAFDANGNLYVTDPVSNLVERLTPGGTVSLVLGSIGLNTPTGIAFDASGNLYVANNNRNNVSNGDTIERFTPNGSASVFASTGLSRAVGLAFDASGNLYATNQGNGTIERFTPGGVASVFASTGPDTPGDLAFDASGNLYVAYVRSNTIEKFTPGGSASVFASAGIGLNFPFGLAFDASGNLYASVPLNGIIREFTPGGAASVFASTGLTFATALAIEPVVASVPEPASAALLAFGLGALGLVRRRAA